MSTDDMEHCLTPHAEQRLRERTTISSLSLIDILSNRKFISLGFEANTQREAKLFFSKSDDKFFIAVQDNVSGHVVTVLTVEYWHNLSEKHFNERRIVSMQKLLDAIALVDPENLVVKFPPVMSNNVFKVSLILNNYRLLNIGSISINSLNSNPTVDLAVELQSQFYGKLSERELDEKSVIGVRWRLKKDMNPREKFFECGIDFEMLVNQIKSDLIERNQLFKKYEDFLEILNRRLQLGNEQGG